MRAFLRRKRWAAFFVISLLIAGASLWYRQSDTPGLWEPPSPEELSEALGPLADLSEQQRRTYSDVGHVIKRAPRANHWLARHLEFGETYSSFVGSGPNTPDSSRQKLYIQPLGDFRKEHGPLLEQLEDFGRRFFLLEAELMPSISIPLDLTRRIKESTGTEQLYTPDILRWLPKILPTDAYCLMAVTMADLYPDPTWNSVFGQAALRDRVGVFSFARFDRRFFQEAPQPGDDLLLLRRCLHIFSHEIGHLHGMSHCTYYECLMNGTNSFHELDGQSPHLCPVCLRKLGHTTSFDPVERARSLAEFYERHDLKEEAVWHRARALWIERGIEPPKPM